MPDKTIHCSKCGKAITGWDFAERMSKLRRHYKKSHPVLFKRGIKMRSKE